MIYLVMRIAAFNIGDTRSAKHSALSCCRPCGTALHKRRSTYRFVKGLEQRQPPHGEAIHRSARVIVSRYIDIGQKVESTVSFVLYSCIFHSISILITFIKQHARALFLE